LRCRVAALWRLRGRRPGLFLVADSEPRPRGWPVPAAGMMPGCSPNVHSASGKGSLFSPLSGGIARRIPLWRRYISGRIGANKRLDRSLSTEFGLLRGTLRLCPRRNVSRSNNPANDRFEPACLGRRRGRLIMPHGRARSSELAQHCRKIFCSVRCGMEGRISAGVGWMPAGLWILKLRAANADWRRACMLLACRLDAQPCSSLDGTSGGDSSVRCTR
jgi:hypothetical protein